MSLAILGTAYNGTMWVRVGVGGLVQTSLDAVDWTLRVSGVSNDLHDIAYGFGRFIAVGDGGTVITSTNGTSWTSETDPTTQDLYAIIWAGVFFAVGGDGVSDSYMGATVYGSTWVTIPSGTTNILRSVSASGGVYEAVGDDSTYITGAFVIPLLDVVVAESFTASETDSSGGSSFNVVTSDNMELRDYTWQDEEAPLKFASILEDIRIYSAPALNFSLMTGAISETINFILRSLENEEIKETLTFSDTLLRTLILVIAEQLTLNDVPTALFSPNILLTDDFTVADTSVLNGIFIFSNTDTFSINDTPSATGTLQPCNNRKHHHACTDHPGW